MIVCIHTDSIPLLEKSKIMDLTIGKSYRPLNLAIEWQKSGILIQNDSGKLRYYHPDRFESLSEIREKKLEILAK
jgi:hypothetical protein